MVATEQISIKWKSDQPVWVPQWPLPKEKLEAAHMLVKEQLDAGHIRESISPWNTPISIIKKKSGKWRLLHDLHAVITQMEIMGSVQLGLRMTSSLQINWTSIVIILIDCFFTIPLHPTDDKFASTLPSINHSAPHLRYELGFYPKIWQITLLCASFM